MDCTQQANLKLWINNHTPQEVANASRNLTISELAIFHTVNGGAPSNMPLISERQFQTLMDHLNGVKKPSFFDRIKRRTRQFFFNKVQQPDLDNEFDKITARHEKSKVAFYEQEFSRLKSEFQSFGPSIELGERIQAYIEQLSQFPKVVVEQLLNGYRALLKTNHEALEFNSPDISAYETLLPDFPMWNRRIDAEEANIPLLHDLQGELERIWDIQYGALFPKMASLQNRYFENPNQVVYDYRKIWNFSINVMAVAIEGLQTLIGKVNERYHERFPEVDFSNVAVGLPPGIEIEEDIPVGILIDENEEPLIQQ